MIDARTVTVWAAAVWVAMMILMAFSHGQV
jgi:hypothetical protein